MLFARSVHMDRALTRTHVFSRMEYAHGEINLFDPSAILPGSPHRKAVGEVTLLACTSVDMAFFNAPLGEEKERAPNDLRKILQATATQGSNTM